MYVIYLSRNEYYHPDVSYFKNGGCVFILLKDRFYGYYLLYKLTYLDEMLYQFNTIQLIVNIMN